MAWWARLEDSADRADSAALADKAAGARNLPAPPQVAAIPAIKPLTGPGKVYDSASALWPGKGLDRYNYVADEYLHHRHRRR